VIAITLVSDDAHRWWFSGRNRLSIGAVRPGEGPRSLCALCGSSWRPLRSDLSQHRQDLYSQRTRRRAAKIAKMTKIA